MPWLDRLGGAWLLLTLLVLLTGAFSHRVPSFDQFIATNMRMADSLRPHLLALAALMALALPLLGMPRLGIGLLAAALCGLLLIGADYAARNAPSGSRTDLTVLWFNMLFDNPVDIETRARALRESGADVIALAETVSVAPLQERLGDLYPYRIGCTEDPCERGIALFSKYPLSGVTEKDFPAHPHRFLRMHLELPGRAPVTLTAVHLSKPWLNGVAEREIESVYAALRAPREQPYILMGDFNAAPWSRRITELERDFGMRHAPRPVPTWPAVAGRLGVPIDHVLLRGGVGLVSQRPWGARLGSNHRGLLTGLRLPESR